MTTYDSHNVGQRTLSGVTWLPQTETIIRLGPLVDQSEPGKCRLLDTYGNKFRHKMHIRWIKLLPNSIFISGKYELVMTEVPIFAWLLGSFLPPPFFTHNQAFSQTAISSPLLASINGLNGFSGLEHLVWKKVSMPVNKNASDAEPLLDHVLITLGHIGTAPKI